MLTTALLSHSLSSDIPDWSSKFLVFRQMLESEAFYCTIFKDFHVRKF
jgi:hypothetical protein